MGSLPIGLGAALVALALSVWGQTWQRLSRLETEQNAEFVNPWRRSRWLLGTAMYFFAALFDAGSYLYAPIAMILVIYALKLPVVAITARVCLKVHISPGSAGGIALCAFGSVVSLAFAPRPSVGKLHTPADFFTLPMSVYLCGTAVTCALLIRVVATSTNLSVAAWPLLTTVMSNVEKLFSSAIGRLASGEQVISLKWFYFPLLVVVLMGTNGLLSLCAIEQQSPHTFVPMGFGFTAIILGTESFLFGEFLNVVLKDLLAWIAGMLIAVIGTVLIAVFDKDHDAPGETHEAPGEAHDHYELQLKS